MAQDRQSRQPWVVSFVSMALVRYDLLTGSANRNCTTAEYSQERLRADLLGCLRVSVWGAGSGATIGLAMSFEIGFRMTVSFETLCAASPN